jgi:hypothetical protein
MITDPELSSRYWIVRKVVSLVGYFGGLRNIELRSIEFGKTFASGEKSFEMTESGFWFCFERGKQRGLPGVSTFCVPRRQADWIPTVSTSDRSPIDYDPASVIDHYLAMLELDLKKPRDELTGGFFKSVHGKGARFYRQVPMGKNLLEKVGREMAEELFLPNPATYTSHCWRRSCGTNSSDAGVNVTTLMSHLGWTTPKTAIGYVQKSKMTSYNMAMFLSNVQRQNKDLDDVFGLLKSFISEHSSTAASSKEEIPAKKKKKNPKESTLAKVLVPDVSEQEVNRFSSYLVDARKSDSKVRTREKQKAELETNSIVSSINESVFVDVGGVSQPVGEDELVSSDLGGGGGDNVNQSEVVNGGGDIRNRSEVGGVGGGVSRSAVVGDVNFELDPRVASILSNLRNHGEIHVHFHFGNS